MDRTICFENIQNVRDLGGLRTGHGREIAKGLLFRSANLSGATEADSEKLKHTCHLVKVIDLRTGMEKEQKPDVSMRGVIYVENPIFDVRVIGISHEKTKQDSQEKMPIPVMEDLYRMMVTNESCRKNLGKAVQIVMTHDFSEGSVLWHCTEGKDRCGLLSMVLLGALQVEREVIMEDYLLTNQVNGPKAELYYQQMRKAGKSEAEAAAVKNVFLAKEAYLNAVFEAIEEQYPNMEAFLTEGLEIPWEVIVEFREKMGVA